MSDLISISVDISSSDFSVPLGLEIWVDNQKVLDRDHVKQSETVNFNVPNDDEGQHELSFILKNKTSAHTKIDENGNILKDAVLSISNFIVDGIETDQLLYNQSIYTHSFNNETSEKTQEKFYGNLGCNGTVSLKFTTPIYLWLLEHM